MNHLARLQDLLPAPYSVAGDAIVTEFLDRISLELEAFDEDLDRMRQSHWIRTVYRLADAEKLAALLGIKRLGWETLPVFRERLLALVTARLQGALGPNEIKGFVYDYLKGTEQVLGCTLLPGLQTVTVDQAYAPPSDRPLFRPLQLAENPDRKKQSGNLLARAGQVPYLYRWQETNRGLSDTVASFAITGMQGRRTAVPIIANLTTGDMFGYHGVLAFGDRLEFAIPDSPVAGHPRAASVTVNGRDVSARVFSMSGFQPGVAPASDQLDPQPLLPRMNRGANNWTYLSAGFYDLRALDHMFFTLAGAELREGVFDRTFFDEAVFPSGPVAQVEMTWTETEPASFEVRVPRFLVIEPDEVDATLSAPIYEQAAEGLEDAISELHAAGVRADVSFIPFTEIQRQKVRAQVSWVVLPPESGPSGKDQLVIGGRFDGAPLGRSKFSG